MIKLEVSAFEGHSSQVFSLSQARTTIGRNPTNDIVVDSKNVSGAHAEIVRTDEGGLKIKDLGSVNGTFLNGKPITGSRIGPGDRLLFGNIECVLMESAEAQPVAFGSLAISQAKQAMEKLNQESPEGPDQTGEPEIDFQREDVAAENAEPAPEDSADAAELAAAAAEMESLRAQISELESQSAEEESADAEAELAAAVAEVESLRTQISELKSQSAEEESAGEELAAAVAEVESLRAQISELENQSAEQESAGEELAAAVAEVGSLRAQISELENQSAEQKSADAAELAAAAAVEMDSLRTRILEIEKDRSDLVRANESLRETLAEKTESITEMSGQLQEKDAALTDRRRENAKLDAEWRQVEQGAAEKIESAEAETAALRAEVEALKEAHGEVADSCAELGAVQQQIESYGPQRDRLQQELNDFLAHAEATREVAVEENAEVRRALKDSRKELESLSQAVNEAEQQVDLRRESVEAGIRELEDRNQTLADALAGLEEQRAVAEQQLEEVAVSTREMESKRDRLDAESTKTEKVLGKIQGKIRRRKKLLERLKAVGRRERAVAKKIKEGKQFLDAAEARKAAADLPKIQPWDVDRARVERDEALEEARTVRQEVDRMKVELKDRQRELEGMEAGDDRRDPGDPPLSEDHHEPSRERGESSRLTAQLP